MIISPSILSADFLNLKEDIGRISNALMLHIDVMDGNFVPNISFGAKVQKDLRKHFKNMKFDTHLMINDPKKYIKDFVDAGSDFITFHVEAVSNCVEIIDLIHSYNVKAGISIKPSTKVEDIEKYLNIVDLVLVMSVEPGFAGQAYMPSCEGKIRKLYEIRRKHQYKYSISVDGGINDKTFFNVKNAGADVAVMGSFLFAEKKPSKLIDKLQNS